MCSGVCCIFQLISSNPNSRWLQSSHMLLIMSELFPRCVTLAGYHLTDVLWSLLHFSTDIVQSKFSLAAVITYAVDHVRNIPEMCNACWLSLGCGSLLHFSTDIVQSKFSLAAVVMYAVDHVRNIPEMCNACWLSLD